MTATPIKEAISVRSLVTLPDGVRVAEVPVADYIGMVRLPEAIRVGGEALGRSGWNSDTLVVYYRSDVVFAVPA